MLEDAYYLPYVDWMLEGSNEKVERLQFASRIVKAARENGHEIWTPAIDSEASKVRAFFCRC